MTNYKQITEKVKIKLKKIYSTDGKNPNSLNWNIVKDAIKYSIYYTKKENK